MGGAKSASSRGNSVLLPRQSENTDRQLAASEVESHRRASLAARFANAPDVTGISEVGESLEKLQKRALE